MDLKQLLTMLQSVSGPNSSGEYTAKCPAHQDRTASLTATVKASPKDGKEKIYLCCHAGCSGADIMAALGIKSRDLIVNPDEPGRPAGSAAKRQQSAAKAQRKQPGAAKAQQTENVDGLTVHTVPPAEEKKDELIPDWDHPDKVYSYTDEEGRELFQVVRLHYKDGKPGKTFRQRRHDPKDPKANKQGYVTCLSTRFIRLPNIRVTTMASRHVCRVLARASGSASRSAPRLISRRLPAT